MKWFRSNIKRVSHIALFALAIQFALSFGHFHAVADNLTAQSAYSQSVPRPASDHGSGEQGDVCAICVVMAMANSVLFAAPPVVLLPQAIDFSYVTAAANLVRAAHLRAGFQARAPPIS